MTTATPSHGLPPLGSIIVDSYGDAYVVTALNLDGLGFTMRTVPSAVNSNSTYSYMVTLNRYRMSRASGFWKLKSDSNTKDTRLPSNKWKCGHKRDITVENKFCGVCAAFNRPMVTE